MKAWFIRFLRSPRFQGIWEWLFRKAQVGMNHYGGSHFRHSGEAYVLEFVNDAFRTGGSVEVFDVGANTGDYAAMALDILDARFKLHCFEPSLDTRTLLVARLGDAIARGRVVVYPVGAGACRERSTLHLPELGSSVASLYSFQQETRPWKGRLTEVVDIVTLDEHCAEHNINTIHLLKIDVEGHELSVLHGAKGLIRSGSIRFIQFEFGEAHLDARTFFLDFHRLLKDRYDIYRVLPKGLRRVAQYTPDQEVFHTTNYLAVLVR